MSAKKEKSHKKLGFRLQLIIFAQNNFNINSMKGILPFQCRTMGYLLLLLAVFVSALLYMFGTIDVTNFIFVRFGMKTTIWIALFIIFFSKTKDENEKTKNYRTLSTKWALFIWMVYYIVILVKGLLENNLHTTDNSSAIIFMVINVFCFEFLLQKSRIERSYKRK